jgi:transposase
MNTAEKKVLAQGFYTRSMMTRKEIAAQVQVTEKTLRAWITDGDWDKLRDSMQITKPQLLNEAYQQLAAINKRIQDDHGGVPTKELSDAKGVIRKEIEQFENQPIHLYVEVFEDVIGWLSRNEPDKLSDFTKLTQKFLIAKSKPA